MRSVVDSELSRATTPGGVVVAGEGGAIEIEMAFGVTQTSPPAQGRPVTLDTVYDLASVTKVVSTTAVLMRLVAMGTISLDQPAQRWLPEFQVEGAQAVTLKHLVGHASGLPAHIKFYEQLRSESSVVGDSQREALLRLVAATELAYQPGTRTLYSDLGFILLGFALERATGKRLDALTHELITQPLTMQDTRFVDLTGTDRIDPKRVAPTEVCPYRGLVVGEVHDDNAHAAGGVCGHAGLFSTAHDIATFAAALLSAAAGESGTLFDPEVVSRFFSEKAAEDTTWRLGWDSPSPPPVVSHAGSRWPTTGVGHLGFTGTSLWLDVDRHRFVALLTNRVHPSRERTGIRELRRAVMDRAVTMLDD